MVMSTLWSHSRVEMRTAWLEEPGIGACSGREFLLARERRTRENTPRSPTGTHSMLTLIPLCLCLHLPSPIPLSHLSSPPLCLPLSWSLKPHRHFCASLPVFLSFMYTIPTPLPPMCLECMAPSPLCQNGVYGASDRLYQRPEIHHGAPGWRRRGRLR